MQCPYCKSNKSKVVRSEPLTMEKFRIRQCLDCMRYYQTVETMYREVTPRKDEPKQEKLFEVPKK